MNNRRQSGDTIVEVMISLAVISMVIGLAYGIATRSLKQSQQSQERVEASKVAEGQLERLKGFSNSSDLSSLVPAGNFCVTATNAIEDVSMGHCTYNNLYRVTDTYDSSGHLITVQIDWDSATGSGSGQDQLIMYYRVY
ncbi:prepilin-type N-terminal cleavage/methylation domain-containing protein [Candidatus Saccharibacteria bacterium]|nr:prepilin-type N-terminal cleavage/methylation domain-containing protein [Candidatus Saccharibacteria bacterium]